MTTSFSSDAYRTMLAPAAAAFIRAQDKADLAALALRGPPQADWPFALMLDQIKSRRMAREKKLGWAFSHEDILLPSPQVMEQSSSQPCATFKASLCSEITQGASNRFYDLCAGSGTDSWAMAAQFQTGVLVEKSETQAFLLAHNAALLGLGKTVRVQHGGAEEFVSQAPRADLVYLDPQRRDEKGKGRFALSQGSPSALSLWPDLKERAGAILIKLSPMLDITQALGAFDCEAACYAVEWRGECREILLALWPRRAAVPDAQEIHAVTLDDEGRPVQRLKGTRASEAAFQILPSLPLRFIFEPGPAFQKSGLFNTLASLHDVRPLEAHTHLYTNGDDIPGFPGRRFELIAVRDVQDRYWRGLKANLTLRNFPGTAESLKKRLKIKDGGDIYLFACTLMDGRRVILETQKI